MRGLKLSTTKNALANLVRGGATAAVSLVLPRFLTRLLDPEHFSAWSLILQVAAYASYLDFGLQLAVARFIAQAVELEQREQQVTLISTALFLLSVMGLAAFLLTATLIWISPDFFHVYGGLLKDFRKAALVLSLIACLLLPLSSYTGALIGMRRNEIPALAIGGTRILGAVAAILVAHFTQSLTLLALCVGVPNLVGGFIQMAAVRALLAEGRARFRHVSRVIGRELLRFCAGLAVWSFSMLLISGLDVSIVGHFQFSAVGYYSLAAMLITFVSGLTNAALSALMAPISALHARDESVRIVGILFTATRLIILFNLAMTATIFLYGETVLRAWVGPVYAANALPILKILVVAQAVRLALAPYSLMLVSVGEQNKNIWGAICEASVNLGASILGMTLLGPVGVAWGTLAGAVCGVLWLMLRTMTLVGEVRVRLRVFLTKTVVPGAIPFLPLILLPLLGNRLTDAAETVCVGAVAVLICFSARQSFRPMTTLLTN